MSPLRHTEEVAAEEIPKVLSRLTELTKGQPTTAKLLEAQQNVRALQRALSEWIGVRHLTEANTTGSAEFRERFPEVAKSMDAANRKEAVRVAMAGLDSFCEEIHVNDAATDEQMDDLEARQIDAAYPAFPVLDPIFQQILAPFQPTKEAI